MLALNLYHLLLLSFITSEVATFGKSFMNIDIDASSNM